MRLTVAFSLVIAAGAQQQPAARPEFDVVSVKPGDPADPSSGMRTMPGRLEMRNATLKWLLMYAYRPNEDQVLNEYQLDGGPKWMDSSKFDIQAKLPAGAPASQIPPMLQAMLADRFKLAVHRETRTRQVYALVVAKGGPKLQPAREGDPGGSSSGDRMIQGLSQPVSALANMLAGAVGAPVVDQTGLQGKYNFNLRFTPFFQLPKGPDDGTPDILGAVQELGLKLESRKGPVEVLVIDHAELPTPN